VSQEWSTEDKHKHYRLPRTKALLSKNHCANGLAHPPIPIGAPPTLPSFVGKGCELSDSERSHGKQTHDTDLLTKGSCLILA